jgi:cytosine/uracil/thiamine/allantoin permease
VAPNLIGFLHATRILARPAEPDIWDKIYPYSWFVGFGVAFVLYLVGMLLTRRGDQLR